MIDFIKGEIVEISPTFVVLEANQIGYFINITLSSYSELNGKTSCKLYIYESIREDAHVLYGFLHKSERELFLQLISVSGVGANTARMMLSSVSVSDLQNAIANEDLMVLKNIKGIGAKTAQRIVVDLKDKVVKLGTTTTDEIFVPTVSNPVRSEAVSALVMLGFIQSASAKVVDKILRENPSFSVEQTIKMALKLL